MLSRLCRTTTKLLSNVSFPRYASTIYAKSSGHGKCGVSVIRVSGPDARVAFNSLTKTSSISKKQERKFLLRKVYDPESSEVLDNALVVWFSGPNSFTGEDSCEFHVHGGPAVISAVLSALSKVTGLRHAKSGEFTRRAFYNEKLGLTEIEALGDLIHSETEAQRKQAIRGMDGVIANLFANWRKSLLQCAANVEAWIDFSEEENIESDTIEFVLKDLKKTIIEMDDMLKDQRRGERLRSGVNAVIVGRPNVGKSSLLNMICQRPVSIVSPIAGTTRDVVESAYDIGGYPVLLSDTAGLRQTTDSIEEEGVRRAEAKLEHADLAIVMLDAQDCERKIQDLTIKDYLKSEFDSFNLPNWILDNILDKKLPPVGSDLILVVNKSDLINDISSLKNYLPNKTLFLSCKTEDGIVGFSHHIKEIIENICGDPLMETGSLLRERHIDHLKNSKKFILEFLDYYEIDLVIAARKMRLALNEIGRVTGEVRNDDILDIIFKDFCIGK